MSPTERRDRLSAEFEALKSLKAVSTIFDFESQGTPPDRYTLIFRGEGLARDFTTLDSVQRVTLHRCDLRLPFSFPDQAPDLRWLTPIFHPNISFSGFITVRDLGLTWERRLTLDILCERLWDVARGAVLDVARASNFSARDWFGQQHNLTLPFDGRPLRDQAASASSNIVRYERRGRQVTLPPATPAADVLFIDADTPAPPLPRRATGDLFYIGDE